MGPIHRSLDAIDVALRVLIGLVISYLVVTEAKDVYGYQGWSGVRTDFHGTIWQPNHEVLQGLSPYQDPALGIDPAAVYPPSGFLPFLPLSWLSPHVAVIVFQLFLIAAAIATLIALDVRSKEKWVLWLGCPLVLIPVLIGNITPVVVLAVALLWRWRDKAWLAAGALTAGIVIKLFVAPLVLWLLITRRYRAAIITTIAAPTVILASWTLIGFRGLLDYPAILNLGSRVYGADGPLVQGLVRQWGGSQNTAIAIGIVVATCLVALATRSGEVEALALVCFACLALAPIAWVFYLGILVVPLAASRLPWQAWALLQAFWIVSWWRTPLNYKSAELSIAALALSATLIAVLYLFVRSAAQKVPTDRPAI